MSSLLEKIYHTAGLRLWSFMQVPLLYQVCPVVETLDEHHTIISVPLRRRTRNHLHSMYMGALICGADLAAGLIAFHLMKKNKQKFSIVFKELKAEFLQRPEARTYFHCTEGKKIQQLLQTAQKTGKRAHAPIEVIATCPEKTGDIPIARFTLTLSVKLKT
jgi:acyl-coenzyme A thioesterase PaaI-like protein